MGGRHSRLAAALAASWDAEVVSARRLSSFAERVSDPALRARLLVLAAFCRAHSSRILARLATMGRGPLPVPELHVDDTEDFSLSLTRHAASAQNAAMHYQLMGEMARKQSDLSTAWVCELNRSEEAELALELTRLREEWLSRNSAVV